jgi:hypothetical protein
LISNWVKKSAKGDEVLGERRREKGTLIASGFIAGGALMGVLGAVIKYIESETGAHILPDFANDGVFGNWLSLFMLFVIGTYLYVSARRAKKSV